MSTSAIKLNRYTYRMHQTTYDIEKRRERENDALRNRYIFAQKTDFRRKRQFLLYNSILAVRKPMNSRIHSIYFIYLPIQLGIDKDPSLPKKEPEKERRAQTKNSSQFKQIVGVIYVY